MHSVEVAVLESSPQQKLFSKGTDEIRACEVPEASASAETERR